METWRFLASLGVLLVVWAILVTLLGEPPTPGAIVVATVFAAIGIYLSDTVVKQYFEDEPSE